MYIALLKTRDNQFAIEQDTLGQALNTLRRLMEGREGTIKEALVLEETEYLDDQCPDFSSCKVVASLGIIK
jgi:hypothetical protein